MISLQNQVLEQSKDCAMCQLRTDIEQGLRGSCFVQLRNLVCECHGKVVVLRGRVDSYYYKQMAQELVRKVDRNVPIANLLTVS